MRLYLCPLTYVVCYTARGDGEEGRQRGEWGVRSQVKAHPTPGNEQVHWLTTPAHWYVLLQVLSQPTVCITNSGFEPAHWFVILHVLRQATCLYYSRYWASTLDCIIQVLSKPTGVFLQVLSQSTCLYFSRYWASPKGSPSPHLLILLKAYNPPTKKNNFRQGWGWPKS